MEHDRFVAESASAAADGDEGNAAALARQAASSHYQNITQKGKSRGGGRKPWLLERDPAAHCPRPRPRTYPFVPRFLLQAKKAVRFIPNTNLPGCPSADSRPPPPP